MLNALGGRLTPGSLRLTHVTPGLRRSTIRGLSATRTTPGRGSGWLAGMGGQLSFELAGGMAAAGQLIQRLTLPNHAPSFGGCETLIARPATTSHAGVLPEVRRSQGMRWRYGRSHVPTGARTAASAIVGTLHQGPPECRAGYRTHPAGPSWVTPPYGRRREACQVRW